MLKSSAKLITTLLATALLSVGAQATVYNGTAYYTTYVGGGVYSVSYSYDNVTKNFTTGAQTPIATLPGADGIIFAPNGNLIVGGQGAAAYNVNPANGSFTSASTGGNASFHVTLAPNGQSVYTSPFNGPLVQIPLANFGTANAPTITPISGSENGITQLAFVNGSTFYVTGNPNGFGNVGSINLATGVTTRFAGGTAVQAAHGIVYDPYSGLINLFGAGQVATINPLTNIVSASVGNANFPGDFDQGASDGLGHALVAGSNGLTFIDYEGTSILTPNFVKFVGGFNFIDDIAPLAGLGSQPSDVPVPAALPLFASGLGALGFLTYRRRRKAIS